MGTTSSQWPSPSCICTPRSNTGCTAAKGCRNYKPQRLTGKAMTTKATTWIENGPVADKLRRQAGRIVMVYAALAIAVLVVAVVVVIR